MKLHSMKLTNFRGLKDWQIQPAGKSLNIQGDNATGKTTVANAYSYLLTDKAFDGELNFSPKTINRKGPVHNQNHIVEAVFIKPDGTTISLTKDFHEVWTKKRGSKTEEMTGNTVDYYVNDVPVKAKDFNETVADLFGEPAEIAMLSNPLYFAEKLHWKERRDILLSICGEVNEDDVIDAVPGLRDVLGTYSVEELQKIMTAKRKKINEELTTLPARIDEANRAMPEVEGVNEIEAVSKIEVLESQIKTLETLKAGGKEQTLAAAQRLADLQTELIRLKSDRANAEADHAKAQRETNREIDDLIFDEEQKRRAWLEDQKRFEQELNTAKDNLSRMLEMRKEIQAQLQAIKAETFTGDTTCPTCHQALPEDQIATAKEQWNLSRAKRYEALVEKGTRTCGKVMIESIKESVNQLTVTLETSTNKVAEADETIKTLKAKRPEVVEFVSTDIANKYDTKIRMIETEITDIKIAPSVTRPEHIETEQQINEIRIEIEAWRLALQRLKLAEEQQKRIAELEDDELRLGQEYEATESALSKCEQYIKLKADMMTANVNEYFRSVNFKLFEEQVNGGVKDQCEVLIPAPNGSMIPWSAANHAGQINAGLEIIEALAKNYQRSIPIIIDSAESVTRYIDIEAQIIRLSVAEGVEELSVA